MSTPNLINIEQLAICLGLSKAACYRRHQRGQLPPAVRIGRSLRWRVEDVTAALAPIEERLAKTTNPIEALCEFFSEPCVVAAGLTIKSVKVDTTAAVAAVADFTKAMNEEMSK